MTRDPGWESRGDPLAHATESLTSQAASGNPFDELSPTDRLIFLAKAFRVPIPSTARALHLSRETLYSRLRVITAELEQAARDGSLPSRPWACRCGRPRLPGRVHCRACWNEYHRAYRAKRRELVAGESPP